MLGPEFITDLARGFEPDIWKCLVGRDLFEEGFEDTELIEEVEDDLDEIDASEAGFLGTSLGDAGLVPGLGDGDLGLVCVGPVLVSVDLAFSIL